MSRENLLKFANDQKPADFAKEFKSEIDTAVQNRLNPSKESEGEDEGDKE